MANQMPTICASCKLLSTSGQDVHCWTCVKELRARIAELEAKLRDLIFEYAEYKVTAQDKLAAAQKDALLVKQPVAWRCISRYGQKLDDWFYASNPEYIKAHKDWDWTPLYAAPKEVRDAHGNFLGISDS